MTPQPAKSDSLDIIELQMALEASLERQLTEAETRDLADRLAVLVADDPSCLQNDELLLSLVREFQADDDDYDDLLGVPVRKPDPDAPRPRHLSAAVRPESQ